MDSEAGRREKEWPAMIDAIETKRDPAHRRAQDDDREAELDSLEEERLQSVDRLMQPAARRWSSR